MRRFRRSNQVIHGAVCRMKIIAMLILCGYLLLMLERQIRPVMIKSAQYECRQLCMTAMNQAVADAVAVHPERFRSLYQFRTDANGKITYIAADPLLMNTIKSDLTTQVSHRLSVLGANIISIPIGSLLGWHLMAGRGPALHLRIIQESYVDSDIESRVRNAGINQTELTVMIHFKAAMSVILSGYSTDVEVEDEICIAQVLIAGHTPQVSVQ